MLHRNKIITESNRLKKHLEKLTGMKQNSISKGFHFI